MLLAFGWRSSVAEWGRARTLWPDFQMGSGLHPRSVMWLWIWQLLGAFVSLSLKGHLVGNQAFCNSHPDHFNRIFFLLSFNPLNTIYSLFSVDSRSTALVFSLYCSRITRVEKLCRPLSWVFRAVHLYAPLYLCSFSLGPFFCSLPWLLSVSWLGLHFLTSTRLHPYS